MLLALHVVLKGPLIMDIAYIAGDAIGSTDREVHADNYDPTILLRTHGHVSMWNETTTNRGVSTPILFSFVLALERTNVHVSSQSAPSRCL